MFSINSVEVQSFKAFKEPQEFVFPTQPGLYFMTGQNKLHPRLGANGVGKSSLLDAIFWCLYGRSTRGLKAGDIVSWGHKYARVEVKLTVGEVPITVVREQAPNSLCLFEGLQGRPVDQDAVNKALRLNAEGFLTTVMHSQFGEPFLQLSPAEKLTLFSQIMELDMWLEKSRTAADLAKELENEAQETQRQIASREGQIEILKADIEELKKQEKAHTAKCVVEIDNQHRLIKKAKQEIAKINNEIAECGDVTDTTYATITKALALLEGEQHSLNKAKRETEEILRILPEAGVTCPQCQQTVTKLHINIEQKRLKAKVKQCNDDLARVSLKLKKKYDERTEHMRQRQTASNLIGQANQYAIGIKNAEEAIEALREDHNPYTSMLKSKQSDLAAKQSVVKKFTTQLNNTNEELAAVSYWVSGFKKLRLSIIETTLKQLEIEINNNLASLGMPEWAITLDVERENKSGGVTKGFTVFVHAPGHSQPVRFEAWSGGETQRLCLAGDLGLSNLIMERAGLVGDVEFYDEPSAHLSQEGLLDLAETLAERARAENKRILLIDHNVIDFGDFAGRYCVVKDKNGSHIVSE